MEGELSMGVPKFLSHWLNELYAIFRQKSQLSLVYFKENYYPLRDSSR